MKTTIVFHNRRMPFVTSSEPTSVWLGYAYLDFGGYRFFFVPSKSKPDTYFGWTIFDPAMSGEKQSCTWLGEFTDAASLDTLLAKHDIDPPACGKIIEEVASKLGWELPED